MQRSTLLNSKCWVKYCLKKHAWKVLCWIDFAYIYNHHSPLYWRQSSCDFQMCVVTIYVLRFWPVDLWEESPCNYISAAKLNNKKLQKCDKFLQQVLQRGLKKSENIFLQKIQQFTLIFIKAECSSSPQPLGTVVEGEWYGLL